MKEQLRAIFCSTCKEATAGLVFDDESATFSVLLQSDTGESELVEVDSENPLALKCLQCGNYLVVDFDYASPDGQLTGLEAMREMRLDGLQGSLLKKLEGGQISAYDAIRGLVIDGVLDEKDARLEVLRALGGDGPTAANESGERIYSESGRLVSEIEAEMAALDARLGRSSR